MTGRPQRPIMGNCPNCLNVALAPKSIAFIKAHFSHQSPKLGFVQPNRLFLSFPIRYFEGLVFLSARDGRFATLAYLAK
jgi:hypothetical protein